MPFPPLGVKLPPPLVQLTKAYPVLKPEHKDSAWLSVLSKSGPSATTSREAPVEESSVEPNVCVSMGDFLICPSTMILLTDCASHLACSGHVEWTRPIWFLP